MCAVFNSLVGLPLASGLEYAQNVTGRPSPKSINTKVIIARLFFNEAKNFSKDGLKSKFDIFLVCPRISGVLALKIFHDSCAYLI
jgi:hypothetical protein